MKVSVILPAAGLGTRMKAGGSAETSGVSRKQFMLLEGSPILLHTIRKFVASRIVSEVVVALRQEELAWVQEMITREKFSKPVRLVPGGDSRQQSVENALASVSEAIDVVAVHDAVRPFIDPETIEQVILEAAEHGAAIVGIVPVDTVKQVQRHVIRGTLNRDRLVLAQTPQAFRTEILRAAFKKASDEGFTGTDESSLVERLENVDVRVVAGSDRNIKITRPSDIDLAKLFLAAESEKAEA
jgi:2-C-methyl-D-erythritol 4-phosphate cytidylyltransferase